jgi:ketosteroid isomerase-like protein
MAMAVATQLLDAMNDHDLAAFLRCFHDDYRSEQPVHPGRGFGGRDQVRANWSAIFSGVSDFSADLLSYCEDGGREWSEWRWTGTRQDGSALDMVGVIIFGVRDGRISWGRLYVEPVHAPGETIDEAVRQMAGADPDESPDGSP